MGEKTTVIVYGFGKRFLENENFIKDKYHIVAIADCDVNRHGRYKSYDVIHPSKIKDYSFEKIVVTPNEYRGILPVLQVLEIPNGQVELLVSENDHGHKWKNISKVPLYDGGIQCIFDEIQFVVRNKSDFMVMDCIFQKNWWNFHCQEKVVVIDIGMNIGLTSLYFANMENVEYVYGYEPFSQTYDWALENFLLNPKIKSKIRSINCALTDRENSIEVLYDSYYTTNMRIDGGERKHGEEERNVWIHTRSAAAQIRMITREHEGKKIVLKLNCEGSEYPVFQDLESQAMLGNIYMILMATHDGRENEIKECLSRNGFVFFDHYTGGNQGYLYAVNLAAK